jgi:predicted permease
MSQFTQGLVLLTSGVLGYLLTSTRSGTVNVLKFLNPLNSWFIIPMLFFMGVIDRGLLPEDLDLFLLLVVYLLLIVPVILLMGKGLSGQTLGSVILAGALMNSVNLPFSLLLILQGSYGYAATFASGVSFFRPIVALVAYQLLMGRSGRASTQTYVQGSLSIVGLLTGGILHPFLHLPPLVTSLSTVIGLSVIIFSFGVSLRALGVSVNSVERKGFTLVALTRCVLSPILILVLSLLFLRGNTDALRQVVLESAMPPAVTDSVFARIYGFDLKFTLAVTLVLTPVNTVEGVLLYYLVR